MPLANPLFATRGYCEKWSDSDFNSIATRGYCELTSGPVIPSALFSPSLKFFSGVGFIEEEEES